MTDLNELIEACKRNKRAAQDELYKRYSSMVFGVCLRYTNCRHDAEDVMQEGWVKIFKSIDSFSMEYSFEGWIRRIMINTAITHYRKNLKHAYQDDITEMAYTRDDHQEAFLHAEFNREELLKAINALPDGYRVVFNMYVVEGYKHKEIADMLEIDINTSKSQLSRAKKYLQRELQEMSKVYL